MKKVLVLTGAGISAESGLKTFRDSNGLWEGYRPEEVATPEAFDRDPELVQRFYNARRHQLLHEGVYPNRAHEALAVLEDRLGDDLLIVTQNVDNLHEQAGSQRVLHMHGELLKKRCSSCDLISVCEKDIEVRDQCVDCGREGSLRPHIVWFGEMPFGLDRIWSEARSCDLFLAIGTSGVVEPAASLAFEAGKYGADTVCHALDTPANRGSFNKFEAGKASETVPRWVEHFLETID